MRRRPRRGWIPSTLVCAGVAACAPGYRLEAASGGTAERAATNGFGLTASVNAWPGGNRHWVGEVLPVWIQVSNQTTAPVRVRYGDFGAIDEHGFWIGIVDPKTGRIIEPPRVGSGTSAPAQTPSERAFSPTLDADALDCERYGACANVELLPAWSDDAGAAAIELVGHRTAYGGRGFDGPPGSSYNRYGGMGYYRGGYFGGYYGYGYPYYGYPGYGYYGWGWPYYGSGVYWPSYYYGYGRPSRSAVPTTAMMQHVALAEGELKSGASTAGFVYLPSAARRATQLDVTWTVHSADAQPLAKVSARFVVVADE